MSKVELLETVDIFDLYGCEFVYSSGDSDDQMYAASRIDEIHAKYLHAARERIKSECKFLGLSEKDFDSMSFAQIASKLPSMLEKELEKQANHMMHGGGFNLMKVVIDAQRMSGADMTGIDTAKFGVGQPKKDEKTNTINAESLLKDPKWHIIAKAFIALEDAKSVQEKVMAIDHLNDLQHNSFHLLIDLQTGRMLEGKSEGESYGKHEEAVNIVKEVLDIKRDAKAPKEYASKMSRDVAKMVIACSRINGFR